MNLPRYTAAAMRSRFHAYCNLPTIIAGPRAVVRLQVQNSEPGGPCCHVLPIHPAHRVDTFAYNAECDTCDRVTRTFPFPREIAATASGTRLADGGNASGRGDVD